MDASPSPTEVFGRLISGISEGRWHDLADLYADDAVVEMPMHPQRIRIEGRDALAQHFATVAGGSVELRAHDVIVHTTADPEVIIAEFRYDGLNRATARTFTIANVQVLHVRSGQIVASRDYHDHRGVAAGQNADGD